VNFFIVPDAQRDLDRLYAFLLPVNPDAAARAINLIMERIWTLDQFPDHGRLAPDGARELIVKFGAGEYRPLQALSGGARNKGPAHLALPREPRPTCAHMPAPFGP
jgi:plasmid stabilization system protein ParE